MAGDSCTTSSCPHVKLEESIVASIKGTRSSRKAIAKWLEASSAAPVHAPEDASPPGSQSSRTYARLATPRPRQQPLTSANGAPVLRAGSQLLFVTTQARATPYVRVGSQGPALLAADGSVLCKGPSAAVVAPLQAPLPRHVPYLVNRCGAPYGLCRDGSAHPLAVCAAQGRAWLGPGRTPLLLREAGVVDGHVQHQLITADGAVVVGPKGQQIRVVVQAAGDAAQASEIWTVAGVVEAATGRTLLDTDGQPLTVDPATLQLQRAIGQPAFDQQGQPLRLQWGSDVVPAGIPSVLSLLLLILLVLLTLTGCTWGWYGNAQLATMLVAAAAAAVATAVGACLAQLGCCWPAAPRLPGPVLLDTYGRPKCDAYGQRLCLSRRRRPTGGVEEVIVSCTGGPLCFRGRGHKADGLHLDSLPLQLGRSSGDVLLDKDGEPLLGAHGQRLRVVLLDSTSKQPHVSPQGYPLALTQAGSPFLGPQQQPLYTTHDGALLLRGDGHPLLSADGRMLWLGSGGRLQYKDGTAYRASGQHMRLSSSSGGSSSSTSLSPSSGRGSQSMAAALNYGRHPVLFGPNGEALADAAGRPLLVGPFDNRFSLRSGTGTRARGISWGWGMWQLQPAPAAVSGSLDGTNSSSNHTARGGWCTGLGDCHAVVSIATISTSSASGHTSEPLLAGVQEDDMHGTIRAQGAAGQPLTCWDVVPMAGPGPDAVLLQQLSRPHTARHSSPAAGDSSTITSSSSLGAPAVRPCVWTLWQVLDAGLLWCQLLLVVACPRLLGMAAAVAKGVASCERHLGACAARCSAAVSSCSWRMLRTCTAAGLPSGVGRWLQPACTWVVYGAGGALTAAMGLSAARQHRSSSAGEVAQLAALMCPVDAQQLPILACTIAGNHPSTSICAAAEVALSLGPVGRVGLVTALALGLGIGRVLSALSRCGRAPTGRGVLLLCMALVPLAAPGAQLLGMLWGAAACVPSKQSATPATQGRPPVGAAISVPSPAVPCWTLSGFVLGVFLSLLVVRALGRRQL